MSLNAMRLPIVALVLLFCLPVYFTENILFLPLASMSHVNEILFMAKELRNRGHGVTVVSFNGSASTVKANGIHHISYPWPEYEMDESSTTTFIQGRDLGAWALTDFSAAAAFDMMCSLMLSKEVASEIGKRKYHLVVVDDHPWCQCGLAYTKTSGAPFITSGSFFPEFSSRSFAASHRTNLELPIVMNNMNDGSFTQRFVSVILNVFNLVVEQLLDHHRKLVNNYQLGSIDNSIKRSLGFLLQQSKYLEIPYVSHPSVHFVGGQSGISVKTLSGRFSDFMKSAKSGVIVVSFGSMISLWPRSLVEKFSLAFSKLPYKAVIRCEGRHTKLFPPNVLALRWMPQNDLLAHENTRLFIGHGGNNGQHEAFYHGVPMLTFDIMGDQRYNGLRYVSRGFGMLMDINNFSAEELAANIDNVIKNASVSEKLSKASNAHRMQQSPIARAADLAEAAMNGETTHMAAVEHAELNMIQFYQIDSLTTVVILVCVILIAVGKFFRVIWHSII